MGDAEARGRVSLLQKGEHALHLSRGASLYFDGKDLVAALDQYRSCVSRQYFPNCI
jgi:hypothetical protein